MNVCCDVWFWRYTMNAVYVGRFHYEYNPRDGVYTQKGYKSLVCQTILWQCDEYMSSTIKIQQCDF